MSAAALQKLDFIVSLIDKVSAPASKMMKTMDTVTTNVQAGFTKIGFGAAGLVGVGYAVDRLISKAVEFESVMADVNKTVDFATPDGLAKFSNDILEMTKTLPLTAEGLGNIAAAGGRLGLKEIELPDFVNVTAKMATAFDIQADMAGDYAANLSNIYHIPINQLGLLGDAVNHLSDNTAAKAGDIIDVLQRVGGAAKSQFGLGANQIAAMSASMLALGIPTEQVGTSINAMLLRLKVIDDAGPKAQKSLAALGLTGDGLAKSIKDNPQAALDDFLQRISKADSSVSSKALTNIFGLEHAPKIALLAGSFDQYGKTLDLVADKQNYVGSMQTEFEVRSNTTANKLILLGSAWDRLMIGFGSIVLPAVINGIGILTSVLDPVSSKMAKWTQMFPNLSRWVGYLAGFIVGVIAVLSVLSIVVGMKLVLMAGWKLGLAGVTSAYGFLKKSIITTIPAILKFTAALLANPMTWIVVGIVALIAVVIAAIVYWDEWTGAVVNFASSFLEMIGVFGVVDGVLATWDKLPQWWASFKNWLGTLDPFSFVGDSLDWLMDKISLIPGINISSVPDAPKPIAAPASMQSQRGGVRGPGLVNQISNASSNNSRSIGAVNINNYGQPMNGQTLADELAFAGG